jgi:hypothetical protein
VTRARIEVRVGADVVTLSLVNVDDDGDEYTEADLTADEAIAVARSLLASAEDLRARPQAG